MLCTVQCVLLTNDLWSSNSCNSYITVSCHFIDEIKLICQVLNIKEVAETHTEKNIESVLSLIFDEWEILDKTVTIILVNSAKLKCAVKDLHCVVHVLNLIVNESFTENQILKAIFIKC